MSGFDARAVIKDLQQQVIDAAELNAALGYMLDPRLPAPEVFERPNWTTYFCTHGVVAWQQAHAVMPWFWRPCETILDALERLSKPPQIEVETIRPYEWHEVVCTDGATRLYAIGFSERSRTWFVFCAGAVAQGG